MTTNSCISAVDVTISASPAEQLQPESNGNNNSSRGAGWAPVKKEFLIPTKPVESAISVSSSAAETIVTSSGQPPTNKKEQRRRGMNKGRKFNHRNNFEYRLCHYTSVGLPCVAPSCKKGHDVQEYIKQRNLSLGLEPSESQVLQELRTILEYCPIYQDVGFCRFGIRCHFAKFHTSFTKDDQTGTIKLAQSVRPDLDMSVKQAFERFEALQCVFESQVQHQIVSGSYPFTQSHSYYEELRKQKQQQQQNVVEEQDEDSHNEKQVQVQVQKENDQHNPRDHAPVAPTQKDGVSCSSSSPLCPVGPIDTESKKKKIDWSGKTYLAPLTTVGNLPFRRVCKTFGVDITCGEMALADQILKGSRSEWALLKRHPSEDLFGVQLCGKNELLTQCVELLSNEINCDFIDLNMGCPIDLVFHSGCGSGLMQRPRKMLSLVDAITRVSSAMPITLKFRTGIHNNKNIAHQYLRDFKNAGVSLCTLHGRSRQQRYTKLADWNYIKECAQICRDIDMPFFGNGDVLSPQDYYERVEQSGVDGVMIGRGALIKPWIFTEIKERRLWDISAQERLEMLKLFCDAGMQHWGSDAEGISKTRRFLLEFHSFHCRYVPVGLLEVLPQRMNDRPPKFFGRNDLETLMASDNVQDWIKLSEMLLGPVSADFCFIPKHKSNSYEVSG